MKKLIPYGVVFILTGCAVTHSAPEGTQSSSQPAKAIAMFDRPLDEVMKLAVAGNGEAMHDLCYRYIYGLHAPLDYQIALKWCIKAAELGGNSSQVLLAEMYYRGEGVDQDYGKALTWYLAAANQGHPHALLMLYYIYSTGHGVKPDAEKAQLYLQEAAATGYQKAIDELKRISAQPGDS